MIRVAEPWETARVCPLPQSPASHFPQSRQIVQDFKRGAFSTAQRTAFAGRLYYWAQVPCCLE